MENMKEKMEFKLQAAFINTGKHVHNNNQRGDAPFSVWAASVRYGTPLLLMQNALSTNTAILIFRKSETQIILSLKFNVCIARTYKCVILQFLFEDESYPS